jgi:putative tryptophan/tyrosine transport system substrate-binding protein
MPIEVATEFDLVINLKTARVLGLPIPPSIVAEATEAIE